MITKENPNEKVPKLYRSLREKLIGVGNGLGPETPDGSGYKFLMEVFDEQDAETVVNLAYQWETAEEYAKRNNMDPKEAEDRLYKASRNGCAYRKKMPNGKYQYQVPARAIGYWEWAAPKYNHEMVSDFFGMASQLPNYNNHADNPYSFFRSMPIGKDVLAPGETLLEYDDIEQLIRNSTKRNIWTCACAEAMRKGGMPAADGSGPVAYDDVEKCHPMETCLFLNDMAEFHNENGWGREVTVEETLDHVKSMLDLGYVINAYNSKKAECVCFCNAKVCMFLGSRMAAPNMRFLNNYVMRRDEDKCVGCGACVSACHLCLNSVDQQTKKAHTKTEYCMGCGVCARKCPTDAIKIYQKPDGWYVPPEDLSTNMDLQVLWAGRTRTLDPLAVDGSGFQSHYTRG